MIARESTRPPRRTCPPHHHLVGRGWWNHGPVEQALQRAFADGHQPWRGSPVLVAEAGLRAAFGFTHPHGRLISAAVTSVVDSSLGRSAEVYLRQPAGQGSRIWLVTAVEPEVGQD
jgi:hypothetical protein